MVMNKNAQAQSIIIFFFLIASIFIVSIILLRFTNEILNPLAQQLNNYNNQSANAVATVKDSFANVWDWVIILVFLFQIIILFVSAFLVDIHPAFIIIYIISIILLFIFGNTMLQVLDNVWAMVGTTVETAQTPMQQFILNNFMNIMLVIVGLSGVIMYSKFKFFGGQGTGGSY